MPDNKSDPNPRPREYRETNVADVAPNPEAAALKLNIRRLLDQVGEKQVCKACGADIWFVVMRSGRRNPYTAAGVSHFADCPEAPRFRMLRK